VSRIAVTGSSGFIGKRLVAALKKAGFDVLEIDILTGYDLAKPGSLDFIPAVDQIIHLAARSFVPLSFENPLLFYQENYLGTLHVLEAARKQGAKLIFFSSYLYGNPQYLPIDEKHPLAPHNPYAQSKLICEKLCEGYYRDFQVPATVFRPFNIYGPGQNTSFLIPKIIGQLKTGDVQLDDPRPRRDFIHVDDVLGAVIKAIELKATGYEIFNLGSGESVSIFELSHMICDLGKTGHRINFTDKVRHGEVLNTVADINNAANILNWRPCIGLSDGIKSLIKQ
jgi:nucleoside-diphosphate-sugar epimerase